MSTWAPRGRLSCQTEWGFELSFERVADDVYAIVDRAGGIGGDTRACIMLAAAGAPLMFLFAWAVPSGGARWQLAACGAVLTAAGIFMARRALLRWRRYREVVVDIGAGEVLVEERSILRRRRASFPLEEVGIGHCLLLAGPPPVSLDAVLLVAPSFRMVLAARPIAPGGREGMLARLPAWAAERLVQGLPPVTVLPSS